MKQLHNCWKELANDCILIMMVCGTIGIALKFTTFFNHWVYFPSFPNVLDATFLISSVLYLTYKARKPYQTTAVQTKYAQKTGERFSTKINTPIKNK